MAWQMVDLTRLTAALADRYRIEREVGAGGMAIVYQARDLRHDRDVALKVLRPELAAALGSDRFLREIRITARLTHPHILPLLDSGAVDGALFYVMPFVEGVSLRDRLAHEQQLPIADAVSIARGVALALGYAHTAGLIHRDIKPENILLPGGEAVVADFGIARAVSEAAGERLTESGLAVGTPAYMSPEQASADAHLDARSDLYSLGCVLYEMLAGEPPFGGRTMQAITARKMSDPVPSLQTVRDTVPPELEAIVGRALARNPADRFNSAQQFADALAQATVHTESTGWPVTPTTASAFPRTARGRWTWAMAAALAIVAAVSGFYAIRARNGDIDLHLSVTTPPGTELRAGRSVIALSPDGRTLVFAAGHRDSMRLYVRRLDEFRAVPIPGTEGGDSPFFSPDGRSVGFFHRKERRLMRVALAGGAPSTVARDVGTGAGPGAWSASDTIYFPNFPSTQIFKVAAAGGAIVPVTHGPPPDGWFRVAVHPLPDGRNALVTVVTGLTAHVDVVSLASGEHTRLLDDAVDPRVVSGGILLYKVYEHPEVLAVPFDPKELKVTGEPVVVIDSVSSPLGWPLVSFLDLADNGTLAYVPLKAWFDTTWVRMMLVRRDGAIEPVRLPRGGGVRFSPDGKRLVYGALGRHTPDILVLDLEHGTEHRITGDEGRDMWPIFSYDGREVLFNSDRVGGTDILSLYRAPADGSGRPERLRTDSSEHQQPFTWARSGQELLYTQGPASNSSMRIWVLPMAGDRPPHLLFPDSASGTQPAVSADGRWLAWVSDATGRSEVMVRRYPDGPDVRASKDGGVEPVWDRSGRELYFRDLRANGVEVVTFEPSDPPTIGTPRTLFTGRFVNCESWCRNYDVSPDGRRFVMVGWPDPRADTAAGRTAGSTEIRIVPHWDRELRAQLRAAAR